MKNEEQLRKEFYKEFEVDNPANTHMLCPQLIADFFTTHHRQVLEKVEKKVEGLKKDDNRFVLKYEIYEDRGFNKAISKALAIIREEI